MYYQSYIMMSISTGCHCGYAVLGRLRLRHRENEPLGLLEERHECKHHALPGGPQVWPRQGI